MANSYASNLEIKSALADLGTNLGSTHDPLLTTLAGYASRNIDSYTNVEAGFYYVSADTTRWFAGTGGPHLWIGALAAAPTSVSVALTGVVDNAAGTGGTYTALTTSDYLIWQPNALLEGRPYRRLDIAGSTYTAWAAGEKTVKIAGKFGYAASAPPDDIKAAAIAQAVLWFQRGRHGFEDRGGNTNLGQQEYSRLDPNVSMTIEHYRRKPKKGSQ